jgi:hypothetical protein
MSVQGNGRGLRRLRGAGARGGGDRAAAAPAWGNDAGENENARVCLRETKEGTGNANLHRNAGEALLRTRSSSGDLRHSRNEVPRSRFWFP